MRFFIGFSPLSRALACFWATFSSSVLAIMLRNPLMPLVTKRVGSS